MIDFYVRLLVALYCNNLVLNYTLVILVLVIVFDLWPLATKLGVASVNTVVHLKYRLQSLHLVNTHAKMLMGSFISFITFVVSVCISNDTISTLTSPNFPDNYTDNLNEQWTLTVPSYLYLAFQFDVFHLEFNYYEYYNYTYEGQECPYDRVRVSE